MLTQHYRVDTRLERGNGTDQASRKVLKLLYLILSVLTNPKFYFIYLHVKMGLLQAWKVSQSLMFTFYKDANITHFEKDYLFWLQMHLWQLLQFLSSCSRPSITVLVCPPLGWISGVLRVILSRGTSSLTFSVPHPSLLMFLYTGKLFWSWT